METLPDPRRWPTPADAPAFAAELHAACAATLAAATGRDAARDEQRIAAALTALLDTGDGEALARLLATAPSESIHRRLFGVLCDVERTRLARDDAVRVVMFAIPLVIVAGIEGRRDERTTLPAIVADVDALCALLQEHRALGGNTTFALGNALVAPDTLGYDRLPSLLAHAAATTGGDATALAFAPLSLPPAPIPVSGAQESVHLRYLLGAAVARTLDPFLAAEVGRWGVPLAKTLARALAVDGATVLPLPRAPTLLAPGLARGRAAQRETSAHVFASNALRRLRGASGEPTAILSAHRTAEVATGGELRLSLSSPFAPADAEGFRYPLEPLDRIADVMRMLTGLLADYRVSDVRMMPGVQGDRDPTTGLLLLFKADAAAATGVPLH
jgi:hypothetical protein